jgi:hypothetical protein
MAPKQILHRRSRATIGDKWKGGSGLLWKFSPRRCGGLPIPTVACDTVPGFACNHAMSSLGSFAGIAFFARGRRKQKNRLEVLHHVIGQRVNCSVSDVAAPVAKAKRVAIWSCASDTVGTDAGVCSGYIPDNHWLTQRALRGRA